MLVRYRTHKMLCNSALARGITNARTELFKEESRDSSEANETLGEDSKEKIDFGFREVPKMEKENLVGQVFSSVASKYDIMNDLMSGGFHRLWKDRFVECLAPFAGQIHLDVAGGTGDIAFRVLDAIREAERKKRTGSTFASNPFATQNSENVSRGTVFVCDINSSMLQEGQRKASARGLNSTDMQWIEGNAEKLPFEDDSFDSYTIAFGIRNVTDRMAALKDARRVLRRGGRFLCLEFSHLEIPVPGAKEFYDWYSFNIIPRIGEVIAGDANSYRYLVESIRMFPSQEEFSNMICEAGFEGVKYENLMGGVVAIHSGINPV